MNKVLFVDIDGVVTSSRDNGFRDFNLHVVHWLRFLCSASGSKIVISSTWRLSHNKEFWETIFGDLIHTDWSTPDGYTLGIPNYIRGDEISDWLDKHPNTEYIILDDDSDFKEEQQQFHIKCDPHNGLLFDGMLELRERLGVTSFPDADAEIYQHPNMFGTRRLK